MGKITSNELVDFLYYKKLPQIYREEDSKIGIPLYRYLQALICGGFNGAIEDISNMMLLIDPKTIPENLFPFLCESFGLEHFPDIEVTYQRKFLWNIGELIKRRGTFSSVHFLIRALTGLESVLSLEDKTLTIKLSATNLSQITDLETSIKVIENYIGTQIPYYIRASIEGKVKAQIIVPSLYSHSAVAYRKKYKLNAYKEGV